jgi:hypothetical protein
MGDIGFRRKGDNTPMYNPERDYAYITPTLMRTAIELLDANEPKEKLNWRVAQNISQAEIVTIAESLANAQSDFVNAADPVKSFEAALERHGFFNFPYAVRQFLFASIGEVCCAAWFMAVREVSAVGQESPAATDMARFTAAVRNFAANKEMPLYDVNYVAEYRRLQNDALRAHLEAVDKERAKYKTDYYRLLGEVHAKEKAAAAQTSTATSTDSWSRICSLFGKKKETNA